MKIRFGWRMDRSHVDSSSKCVYDMFSQYYTANADILPPPRSVEKREFAFALFSGHVMLRHKCFDNKKGLGVFLKEVIPSDAYYSCAYYTFPAEDMDRKGWLGADLIFDIDADHIPTTCGKVHDKWVCGGCGFVGKGIVPDKCPVCGGQKFDTRTWLCEECLNSAKTESIKLIDMLQGDFGFSEKEIQIFFSGHRGYHVHVESESIKTLDTIARREIVDYVSGFGLRMSSFDLDNKRSSKARVRRDLRRSDSGWSSHIAKGVHDLISAANLDRYTDIGLNKNTAKVLIQNKDTILKSWESIEPYPTIKRIGFETWRKLIAYCAESLSAKIDTVVTTDIHRLIRLPGTLHSKTGLKKIEFPISHLEDFDPLKSAVAFKNGAVRILVSDAPEFRIGDKTFGPYRNQRIELPTAAALLLICKKRAEVAE